MKDPFIAAGPHQSGSTCEGADGEATAGTRVGQRGSQVDGRAAKEQEDREDEGRRHQRGQRVHLQTQDSLQPLPQVQGSLVRQCPAFNIFMYSHGQNDSAAQFFMSVLRWAGFC